MTLSLVPEQQHDPLDRHAERMVLGCVLLTGGASLDDCPLTGADFDWPPHAGLWTLLTAMRAEGVAIDAVTVAGRLRDTPIVGVDTQLLHRLIAQVPSPASAAYYAGMVRDAADLRAVHAAGMRMAQAATSQSAEDARGWARKVLDDLDLRDVGGGVLTVGELLGEFMEELEAGAAPGLSTPWPDLDRLIGALRPGALYVIGARPGLGKSVLGTNLAWHVAHKHGRAALLHSLEMPRQEIMARLISAVGTVDYGSLANRTAGEREWARIVAIQARIAGAPLHIDDRAGLRISDVRAAARSLARKGTLGVVVVDYLQLITPRDPRLPREQQVAESSRALKLLAKEQAVPVVLLAQLNRQVEQRQDRSPRMSDLRESGAVEQDADAVILLHRDDDTDPSELTLGIVKNRQGERGPVSLHFEGRYMRIRSRARDAA